MFTPANVGKIIIETIATLLYWLGIHKEQGKEIRMKNEAIKNAGKKYAEAIKNNPGKGKSTVKARGNAFAEYKAALVETDKKPA